MKLAYRFCVKGRAIVKWLVQICCVSVLYKIEFAIATSNGALILLSSRIIYWGENITESLRKCRDLHSKDFKVVVKIL